MTAPNPFARPAEQPQQPAAQPASPFPAQPAVNPYGPPQQPTQPTQPTQPAYAPPAPATPYGTGPYAQTVPQQPAPATSYGSPWPAGSVPAQAPNAPAFGSQIAPPPPPAPSGEKGADLKAMFGCLVLWMPTALETVQKQPKFITDEQRRNGQTTQRRMTATVVVLDNPHEPGVLRHGGDPYGLPGQAKPHPDVDALPYVRRNMWINQGKIVQQLEGFLPGGVNAPRDGSQGMTVGRVNKVGPAQTDPWFLDDPTPADMTLAGQYVEAVRAGHLPNPLA